MKYSLFFFVLVGVLALFSCNKSIDKEIAKDDFIVQLEIDDFTITNHNGILILNDMESYERMLEYLVGLDSLGLEKFRDQLSFESYGKKFSDNETKLEILDDDVLSTFLNPNCEIVIENKMFSIDMTSKEVTVLNYQPDNSYKSLVVDDIIGVFSCESSVFDQLEGKNTNKSTCPGEPCGFYETLTECGSIEYKVQYIKAGIYFTLKARIKQDGICRQWISMSTAQTNYYTPKNRNQAQMDILSKTTTDLDIFFRPYWSLRGLEDFVFDVFFNWTCSSCAFNAIGIINECGVCDSY